MKKKIYKLTGLRIAYGNLVLDEKITKLGAKDRFRLAKKMADIETEMFESSEMSREKVKVIGNG